MFNRIQNSTSRIAWVLASKNVERVAIYHASRSISSSNIERRTVIPSTSVKIQYFDHVDDLTHEATHHPDWASSEGSAVPCFRVFHRTFRVVVALVIMQSFVSIDSTFNSTNNNVRTVWKFLSIEGLMKQMAIEVGSIYPLIQLEIELFYFQRIVSEPHWAFEVCEIRQPRIVSSLRLLS